MHTPTSVNNGNFYYRFALFSLFDYKLLLVKDKSCSLVETVLANLPLGVISP